MKNSTPGGAGWKNQPFPNQHECEEYSSCNLDDEKNAMIRRNHCYGNERMCSMEDQKRGFKGTSEDGEITLVFRDM
jgi:hypothetical protein